MQTPSNVGKRLANDGSGGIARSFSCIKIRHGLIHTFNGGFQEESQPNMTVCEGTCCSFK